MKRTRARYLLLVNWKGVFYERYELDKAVTALEGTNGAGKTTVMIAAYIALLPDLTRLRFTNVGEAGAVAAEDKGIWGRLGEEGRPSYTAFDFALPDGKRVIAGVHLERTSPSSGDLSPFIISGLADDVRLQQLFLIEQGGEEFVPALSDLQENAARLGGRLQKLAAHKYFGQLFDAGVMPLRLGTEEEKTKLNDMLRTSMMGGISRALTSDLRGFLLKEDTGLSASVGRMRDNLAACRRTRIEVTESQKLEREIGGVYEAGHAMFVAGVAATRERAEDGVKRVGEAQERRDTAAALVATRAAALDEVSVAVETLKEAHGKRSAECEKAQRWLTRVESAVEAAKDVDGRRGEVEEAARKEGALRSLRDAASTTKNVRNEDLRRAQEDQKRAAQGLANLQEGLTELHHRAGMFRQVTRRMDEARRRFPAVTPDTVDRIAGEADAALASIDGARREASRRADDAAAHRRDHAAALSAARTIVGRDIEADKELAEGEAALSSYRDWRALGASTDRLRSALSAAQTAAAKQADARDRAIALGLFPLPSGIEAREHVSSALSSLEKERESLLTSARSETDLAAELRRDRDGAAKQLEALVTRKPIFDDLALRAGRLSAGADTQLVDRAGLRAARERIEAALADTNRVEERSVTQRGEFLDKARALASAGGALDPNLLELADELGAELLARRFEDVDIDEAGAVEARLGALSHALVVDDPRAAAERCTTRASSLESVLFVDPDFELAARGVDCDSSDVIVVEGPAVRVTRVPAQPKLGRRAREQRVKDLRAAADAVDVNIERIRASILELSARRADADVLLEHVTSWLDGDPTGRINDLQDVLARTGREADSADARAREYAKSAGALLTEIESIRVLLADAHYLDPPDHAVAVEEAQRAHASAVHARSEAQRCEGAARVLEKHLAALKDPPLSESEASDLSLRIEAMRRERDELFSAIDALHFVIAHREALDWGDAVTALDEQQALEPTLLKQLEEAESLVRRRETDRDEAEKAWSGATQAWHDAEGALSTSLHQLKAAQERLEELGVDDPTPAAAERALREVENLKEQLADLQKRVGEKERELGGLQSDLRTANSDLDKASKALAAENAEAQPAIEKWERLGTALETHRLGEVVALAQRDDGGARGHVNRVQEAKRQKVLLVERLKNARRGDTIVSTVEEEPADNVGVGEATLHVWLAVREWLRERLPAQIAEVADPAAALVRLRTQLKTLEERLARHEADLRGTSQDVAVGIDVQIRRARGQVDRISKNLDGIKFGTVAALRVRLESDEAMRSVLDGLRGGQADDLMFQPNVPLEEALEQIFQRHRGTGRTGAAKILDYREYVQICVDAQRTKNGKWDAVNPSALSTGESIGVGAAVMMVILSEWERDANALRGKRAFGSVRFLFLDEANRLSADNLKTIIELSQNLELQMLIAAPEVAHVDGVTTYRLVRDNENGQEVRVSGRRLATTGAAEA